MNLQILGNWRLIKMTLDVSEDIKIIPYKDEHYKEVLGLQLKMGDQIEIARLTGMVCEDYLKWHLGNFKECTNLLMYKGTLVGLLGVEVESKTFFFLTKVIPEGMSPAFIRHFHKVLNSCMDDVNVNECYIFIDKEYYKSYKWASKYGFMTVEEVVIDGYKAELMRYTKS